MKSKVWSWLGKRRMANIKCLLYHSLTLWLFALVVELVG